MDVTIKQGNGLFDIKLGETNEWVESTSIECKTEPDDRILTNKHELDHVVNVQDTEISETESNQSENDLLVLVQQLAEPQKQLFTCEVCGKNISTRANLEIHIRVHTQERPYICHVCGQRFIQRSHLISHLTRHKATDGFHCQLCGVDVEGAATAHVMHLPQHAKGVFPCRLCTKPFTSNARLARHVQREHGEKMFVGSDQCPRRFPSMSKLLRHLRWHRGERPYKCEQCGRYFSENSTLKSHLLTHEAKRPYACADCGKSFTQNTNLTRHRRVHTGDKPFVCTQCDKKFSQKSNLTAHRQTHMTHSVFT